MCKVWRNAWAVILKDSGFMFKLDIIRWWMQLLAPITWWWSSFYIMLLCWNTLRLVIRSPLTVWCSLKPILCWLILAGRTNRKMSDRDRGEWSRPSTCTDLQSIDLLPAQFYFIISGTGSSCQTDEFDHPEQALSTELFTQSLNWTEVSGL